jgi:AcrR family transcriptional regulator
VKTPEKSPEKTDVRNRILEASADLIAEDGLSGLSMREVARRAGVSHQAPYHHFSDREAILAELVKTGFEQLHAYEMRALEGVADKTARVAAVGEAYVAFALDQPAVFQLMFRREMVEMDKFPDTRCAADKAFAAPLEVIAEASGASPEESLPDMLACWSLAHGLATLLLEGKMDLHVGATRTARNACVHEIMQRWVRKTYGG